MYHVGQVVKCRIISSVPSARRINLSFMMKSSRFVSLCLHIYLKPSERKGRKLIYFLGLDRISEDKEVQLGSIVSGVVDELSPRGIFVYVNGRGYSKGRIPEEHLADHHGTIFIPSSKR